jgi:hypothetical protein
MLLVGVGEVQALDKNVKINSPIIATRFRCFRHSEQNGAACPELVEG